MSKKRLIVIGGGAAGFFCAVNAARLHSNLHVVILEKTNKLLSKVRISGGGRCNVTHHLFDISLLSKRYPRGQNFVKKTFHQFGPAETVKWFEERGVKLKAEADGRMFPITDSSETIIECLLREASKLGVEIKMNAEVKTLKLSETAPLNIHPSWQIRLANGESLDADYVCVACGGYPKYSMFQWLLDLGHTATEPLPSLFTFNLPKHPINQLMGVSVEKVRVKIEGSKLQEYGPILITHWGLSGPSVLRLSAWGARELVEKGYRFNVHINWLPDYNEQTLKAKFQEIRGSSPSKKISNYNFGQLPSRLWLFLLLQSGVKEDMRFADIPAKTENLLIRNLVDYTAEVSGKTTFKEEFVTAGGINLSEIDANTMMSKKVPHLFFAGEILNVDGITGGFNFQHAWASGWIAAKAISNSR